ncbi:type IV pilus modification protein PilV [Variovorax sp. PvP013]|uniref:type IV pilus modification protein PilV n=1 Tax=Variovorax sp. PvP013 TaxID=3156435 RepID=UPI003D22FE98
MSTRSAQTGSRPQRVAGFTLIEVLVAIVVLSFGLLGMVGLQAASLQANRDARLQSTAILLARELAEMMRGNKEVALKAGNAYLGQFATGALVPPTTSSCLNVGATPCPTSDDVARAQLTEWLARVNDQLPGARVSICADSAPFDTAGLPVWTCSAAAAGAAPNGVVIKIGWTRPSFRRATSANDADALKYADVPSVIVPVTPGSTK